MNTPLYKSTAYDGIILANINLMFRFLKGSNHDILRPSTATSQPRSAFRGTSPTSFKPPSQISNNYESLSFPRNSERPDSAHSQNPYTSIAMPSSPRRQYDSRPSSGHNYEGLHTKRSTSYESVEQRSSKFNPVFDESLSTAVSARSVSAYGSK